MEIAMPKPIEMTLVQTELLDAQAAAKALQNRKADPKGLLKHLDAHATKLGYKKATGAKTEFGLRQKFRAAQPIRPPAGVQAVPVQEIDFELSMSALDKPNSDAEGALGTIRITA